MMKKNFYLIIFLLFLDHINTNIFSSNNLHVLDGNSDSKTNFTIDDVNYFKEANKFYANGEFNKAYDYYKKIRNRNFAVYYNLGNVEYKSKNYPKALFYWRKAEKDSGFIDRVDVVKNIIKLNCLLKKIPEKYCSNFLYFLKEYLKSLIHSYSVINFQLLFLLLWFIFFILIQYSSKKPLKYLFFVFLLMCAFVLVYRIKFDYSHYGVVSSDTAYLYSGPDLKFKKIAQAYKLDEPYILDKCNNFYRIKIAGKRGWINSKYIIRY